MPTLKRDGVSIYYELAGESGTRGTIAFLNGVMASTGSWAFYVSPLVKAGYRVLLHDFRGQLASDKPSGPYSFVQHVEDLQFLLDHLDIPAAHLVGTSYGGEIAMRAAVEIPKRVRSITVIDSVSELDPLLESFIHSWIALAQSGDAELFYWGIVPSIYSRGFLGAYRNGLSERAARLARLPSEFFHGQIELYKAFLRDAEITEELSAVRCPALVLCGEEDILKPPHFSRIIAEAIPHSQFGLIPGCGHVAIFEAAEFVLNSITGFITNQDST